MELLFNPTGRINESTHFDVVLGEYCVVKSLVNPSSSRGWLFVPGQL